MNKNFTLIFLFLTQISLSQSILSYMNFGTEREFKSDKLVLESSSDFTFYNQSGEEKKKEISSYNIDNNLQFELRYDEEGNLKQRLSIQYNEVGKKVESKFENWLAIIGHTSESTSYKYGTNNFLVLLISRDQFNNIIRETTFINDKKGNPTELVIKVKGLLEGKETAVYNYEENQVEVSYFNSSDEFVNKNKSKIYFTNIEPGDIVSEYGDILKSKTYEHEIKYDKYGNWTKKIYYKISNGKKNKKSEIRREIKYRR